MFRSIVSNILSREKTIKTVRIGKENHQCTLLTLDCGNKRDAKIVAFLVGVATAQSSNFIKIYPWDGVCDKDTIAYVAIEHDETKPIMESLKSSPPPLICGWARVLFSKTSKDVGGQRYAYIHEISTNRNKFKGIGSGIIDRIAQNKKIDFISLSSLPDAVSFYEKIGFYYDKRSKEMYKIVKSKPNEKYILQLEEDLKTFQKNTEKTYQKEIKETLNEIKSQLNKKDISLLNKYIQDKTHFETVIDVYSYENNIQDVIDLLHTP